MSMHMKHFEKGHLNLALVERLVLSQSGDLASRGGGGRGPSLGFIFLQKPGYLHTIIYILMSGNFSISLSKSYPNPIQAFALHCTSTWYFPHPISNSGLLAQENHFIPDPSTRLDAPGCFACVRSVIRKVLQYLHSVRGSITSGQILSSNGSS